MSYDFLSVYWKKYITKRKWKGKKKKTKQKKNKKQKTKKLKKLLGQKVTIYIFYPGGQKVTTYIFA
jgi:hypothetical protein